VRTPRVIVDLTIGAMCLVCLTACSTSSDNRSEPEDGTGGSAGPPGSSTPDETENTGGATSTGGAQDGGTSSATGGESTATGGESPTTGGRPTTGGVATTGGRIGRGGMGGRTNAGGLPGTGGLMATGGTQSTGGAPGTGGSANTGGAPATGGVTGCDGGPLSTSVAACEITAPPSTGDYHADCVTEINYIRQACQCLPPLERRTDAEACADQMAQYDYENNAAHGGFKARLCTPGGTGQCECPGWDSVESITQGTRWNEACLAMMWHEVDNPAGEQGHYELMSSQQHTAVACGIYVGPDGQVWAVQNYF
jgi:hypothetical protein